MSEFQQLVRGVRECFTGKTRFEDKKAVLTYLNSFRHHKRGRHGRPDQLRAYPCPHCRGWHVTKRL